MNKQIIALIVAISFPYFLFSQQFFTSDDTLRGSITGERSWWDLTYYELRIRVNIDDKSIVGSTTVFYKIIEPYQTLQIDLQPPLSIKQVLQDGKQLTFSKQGKNAYFVQLEKPQEKGRTESIVVEYEGKPKTALNAPWDGGFSWSKDPIGNHFVATSCEGLGASVWWPCKDHAYDEPDSMLISVTVPKLLTAVSNGRLRAKTDNKDGTKTFDWFVKNPINNYGVNVNIADYAHFSESYEGEKGNLALDYYVLPANLEKAKKQFTQVPKMLKAFEHWFGPYPFYEDSYKLVEVPYLGMEHQSSITYGNHFENGYLGLDLSATGWGLKWDYIIVHESGHEWFANNITCKDMADMWIHESFTTYAESLFVEYWYGKEAASAYVVGTRKIIENQNPIIGIYNVNKEGSGDMYAKGSNMLHTIRQIVNDDEKWRAILRGLNQTFYHQTVDTKQIENYISEKANIDLSKVFDQYLRDIRIPVFEYHFAKNILSYHWTNCVSGFDMPLCVFIDGKKKILFPKENMQEMSVKKANTLLLDQNFYVSLKSQ